MNKAEILAMLKIDLGFTDTKYDERLNHIIDSAESFIVREGASPVDYTSMEDVQIVIMYAGWLWRRRLNPEPMPRSLRWALNNRIFGEKAKND